MICEVAIVVKRMPMHTAMTAKRVDSMATSTILLLFQSAYVLSTKKHSEQVSDIRPKDEEILINIRQLLVSSFGAKVRYRFVVVIKKGTYRAMI